MASSTYQDIVALQNYLGSRSPYASLAAALAAAGLDSSGNPLPSQDLAPFQWPGAGVGQLTLRNGENTRVVDASQHETIDALTRSGWVPLTPSGKPYAIANFQGGQMFLNPDTGQALPLNAILGGRMTPEQSAAIGTFMQTPEYQQAFQSLGLGTEPPGAPPPPPPGGTPTGGGTEPGSTGNPIPGLGPLDESFSKMLNQLIGESRGQANYGQQQIAGALGPIQNFLGTSQNALSNALTQTGNLFGGLNQQWGFNDAAAQQQLEQLNSLLGGLNRQGAFNTAAAEQTFNRRDSLVDNLLGLTTPAIQSAVGNMNTGLDPAVMAALNTQATDATSREYNQAAEALKTHLLESGAMGAGLPGSVGDIVRGYGGLEAARLGQQSGLQQNAILANQQALERNRQLGMQAAGLGGSLTSALGNLYNAAPFSQLANENYATSGGMLNPLGFSGQAGQNMGTAGQLMNPAPFLTSSGNTLQQMLSGATGLGQMGLQGLNTAGQFAETGATLQPGSMRNILLGALLGTGGGLLSGIGKNQTGAGNTKTGNILTGLGEVLGGIFNGGKNNTFGWGGGPSWNSWANPTWAPMGSTPGSRQYIL